jgi:hypothetical protein
MALRYLLDENLRGALWRALQQHNANGVDPVDVLRVGDAPAPPLGTPDPGLLLWAEGNGRVLVSLDHNTMPGHLTAHVQAGHHSPGIFLLRPNWSIPVLVAYLVLHDQGGDPLHYVDRVEYVP